MRGFGIEFSWVCGIKFGVEWIHEVTSLCVSLGIFDMFIYSIEAYEKEKEVIEKFVTELYKFPPK